MHLKSSLSTLAVALGLFVAAPAFAQHDHGPAKAPANAKAGQLMAVGEKDAAWAAKERASYPLDTCVASDEKLGSMGKSPEYIYRATGKPDRLVVFCCSGCEDDFTKDPAKHLAKIDAAKAAKASGKSKAKAGAEGKDSAKAHH